MLTMVGIGLTVVAALALVVVALSPRATESSYARPAETASPTVEAARTAFQTFVAAKPGPVAMASLGSSLTAGNGASTYAETWGWKLKTTLGDRFTIGVHGYPGQTIKAIRASGGVAAVEADHPDIVFVEPGTPNNMGQALSIKDSKSLTAQTIADLRAQLPDAFIVGIVPSPIADLGSNSLGLHYSDYIAGDREALASANVVCDVFAAFSDTSTQLRDGVHPNDQGNTIWADAVVACLTATP
ncbi:SGNH/GDSL hydrolase family protein [Cryobacterium sp. GrIS_2_6]|uniref:SGNH/GDSL hydrolase family protein n=1 Tax=Cryobacterium sp. GrIS_2_6 TaxID=3162785 RepID=UPI002E047EBF|nr:lysophospholipase L1-like esterase [Cryobacterium psychrotolerans]MEC5149209.1 lysophospholipase L1-like esterase [Cryobacterium psychrotolerans]MEC5149290.1 lysophospholipase L1-like esterase [Cryobacterium psychrotolerans]